ncbi:MAG: cobaltochelatase subunit CobN [Methanothrix sp.]|nr:cobaltochelatase subunit CobN [Methanothrix sp.]
MRLAAFCWASDVALLLQAAGETGTHLKVWAISELNEENLQECINSLNAAQAILLHASRQDKLFERVVEKIDPKIPVISVGLDPSLWSFSTVSSKIVSTANAYLLYGGEENTANMIRFIGKEVLGHDYSYDPPQELLWQGLYHPDSSEAFSNVADYLEWRTRKHEHCVGILFFRTYWANGDLCIVDSLIRELEKDVDVLPAFCLGMGDRDLGAKSSGEVVEEYFLGRVDGVINLQSIFHVGSVEQSVQALKRLDRPVFHPLTVYHKSQEEWQEDVHGLSSSEVGWTVALPEFEGLIEPILFGVSARDEIAGTEYERHQGVIDRIQKVARRVKRWIALKNKPPSQRKVAIIMHNNPCASAEATVGSGAHLDTLESVAQILASMKEAGYCIENPPKSGKELISAIMERKAISEFRWTAVEEIVSKGGALALVEKEDYQAWFITLPKDAQKLVCDAWGQPPGEEKDGVPPAMVFEGKMVITGVAYGNAIICVQPKRGCAGARCDGQVCRILHDPEVPPPHQYLATYHWIEESFGADVMIHVGTHGNMEFLPGKSVALSASCFPDIVVGNVPYLYIYNADNPPEGAIAKRRSYAVIVDHMQTTMTASEIYGDLKELEDAVASYKQSKISEKGRAHASEHVIIDLLQKTNLAEELLLDELLQSGASFESILEKAHDKISEIYATQIPNGMHIFGQLPEGEKRIDLIYAILRFDSEMKKFLSALMDRPVAEKEQEALAREFISAFLAGDTDPSARILGGHLMNRNSEAISLLQEKVQDISRRIEASLEMKNLLHGMEGGFIEPGPSGLITRGKPDVLPTGRNFYSLDPATVPSIAAWRVGRKLAHLLITKYQEEQGRIPENVAMYWMASDIMWAEGEQLAQMLFLLGVEPVWKGGRVKGYKVLSLADLGRPRIDITVRVSGITRDCFYNCIELLDSAIQEVAALDEPEEMNFIRKHSLQGSSPARIFASRPGTYGNGVNLAVYASAWKEEKDLTDVFMQWNSYAYGKGVFGQEAPQALAAQLKSVDLTFNKTVTDEYDLLGCCCYFGTYGGLTNAARELSGHAVSTYYGDTRDRENADIRTLAEEVRRVVRTRLLNPKWIEGMKRHGYKGAGDISKQVGRVYGWEATTEEVDDWIFDDIARTFILDEANRKFFQENNPWAMEEMGRRLLEASSRGLWKADKEVLDALKSSYLETEGWMEEKMGEIEGSFQGGSIDVMPSQHAGSLARAWREKMSKV